MFILLSQNAESHFNHCPHLFLNLIVSTNYYYKKSYHIKSLYFVKLTLTFSYSRFRKKSPTSLDISIINYRSFLNLSCGVKGWCMGAQRGHIGHISWAWVCTNGKWVMVKNVYIIWHLRQRKQVSAELEQRWEHLTRHTLFLAKLWALCIHSSVLLSIEFMLYCACFA